jgi:hypothetical protein
MKKNPPCKLKPWIERVIWGIASSKEQPFLWVTNHILEAKLNDYGIYREDYEPDISEFLEKPAKPPKQIAPGVLVFRPERSGKEFYLTI